MLWWAELLTRALRWHARVVGVALVQALGAMTLLAVGAAATFVVLGLLTY